MKYLLGPIHFIATLLVLLISSLVMANPNPKAMAKEMVKVIERLQWSNHCEGFVNANNIGPWGEHILKSMNRVSYPELYRSTPDLINTCPNFDNLKDAEKDYVWVMVLTAMAFFESSCNRSAKAAGPNGIAQGLMQLHLNNEQYYSDGCVRGDSLQTNLTLSCSLSMINSQLRREEKLFSQKSYWEVLRPISPSDKAKNIAWSLMLLPLCQKK